MKPVFQDKFYEPGVPSNMQRGNCWTAAIASLLELDLHEVPNFVQIDVDGGKDWFLHTLSFIGDLGFDLYRVWTGHQAQPEPDEFYMVTGVSPRGNGLYHVVIFQNGEMVHDPHPDGTGILTNDNTWLLRRKNERNREN